MKQVARSFPKPAASTGERHRVDRDDVASVDFDPKNPFTWGRGGRARLVTYDLAAFPAGSTHGLVFAGSGGFETVSTVVSTCLRWTGGMVCLDPTREVADMVKTFAARTAARSQSSIRAIPSSASTCSTGSAQPVNGRGGRGHRRGLAHDREPGSLAETAGSSSSRQSSSSPAFSAISSLPEYEGKRTLKALHEFMAAGGVVSQTAGSHP